MQPSISITSEENSQEYEVLPIVHKSTDQQQQSSLKNSLQNNELHQNVEKSFIITNEAEKDKRNCKAINIDLMLVNNTSNRETTIVFESSLNLNASFDGEEFDLPTISAEDEDGFPNQNSQEVDRNDYDVLPLSSSSARSKIRKNRCLKSISSSHYDNNSLDSSNKNLRITNQDYHRYKKRNQELTNKIQNLDNRLQGYQSYQRCLNRAISRIENEKNIYNGEYNLNIDRIKYYKNHQREKDIKYKSKKQKK